MTTVNTINKTIKNWVEYKLWGFNPNNSWVDGNVLTKTTTWYEWWARPTSFSPENSGTIWQILTKTSTGYNWSTWLSQADIQEIKNIVLTGNINTFTWWVTFCSAMWTEHSVNILTSWTYSSYSYTYVALWYWYVEAEIWYNDSTNHYANRSYLTINWRTVFNPQSSNYNISCAWWVIYIQPWDSICWQTLDRIGYVTIHEWYDETAPLTEPWIYHNASLWLISYSSNWSTWKTLADKNLWATSTDVSSTASYWNYYQFGNNYAFSSSSTPSTTSTQIDWSAYWPWNYYSSSTYYVTNSTPSMWDNSDNYNLWWDTTDTNEARKWPCVNWYHVPSWREVDDLYYLLRSRNQLTQAARQNYFLIPLAWVLSYDYWQLVKGGTTWLIMSSTRTNWWDYPGKQYCAVWRETNGTTYSLEPWLYHWANAMPIRPFKNESVAPTITWTALYKPS